MHESGADECGSCHAKNCTIRTWGEKQAAEWRSGERYADDGPHEDDDGPQLHWIIAGGESGHGARPAHPDWFRSVRDQCVASGVAFFFKQWGEWAPHGDGWTHVVFPDGMLDTWLVDCDGAMIKRVGKATAGRELDGETWSQFPTEAQP